MNTIKIFTAFTFPLNHLIVCQPNFDQCQGQNHGLFLVVSHGTSLPTMRQCITAKVELVHHRQSFVSASLPTVYKCMTAKVVLVHHCQPCVSISLPKLCQHISANRVLVHHCQSCVSTSLPTVCQCMTAKVVLRLVTPLLGIFGAHFLNKFFQVISLDLGKKFQSKCLDHVILNTIPEVPQL